MKKLVAIVSISVLFLLLCFGVGQFLHKDVQQSNDLIVWNEFRLEFSDLSSAADNPWGITAGIIETETEGNCLLLTPGESVSVTCLNEEYFGDDFSFDCKIHPWVAESSDGAALTVKILCEEGEHQERFSINSDESWKGFDLDLSLYNNVSSVELICDGGENQDESCDWVIVKGFQINRSDFGKNDYVRSVTYFGNEWPINFWNSEFDYLDEDFLQIRNDGFNSIILVIPWREFQPSLDPIEYNDYAFDKLNAILEKARDYDLDVYVRVGYYWDYYEDTTTSLEDRFISIMNNPKTYQAWLDYCRTLYGCLNRYSNFKEGFITWEDFWGCVGLCDISDENIRREYSSIIGYQNWVKNHYSLERYNELFGTEFSDYDLICLPYRSEDASMEAFYVFLDDFLRDLLSDSQESFPNLSMEVRLDWDVYKDTNGERSAFDHSATFDCSDSNYIATMYGIPMGFPNAGEKVDYEDAMNHTEYILNGLDEASHDKPVYIEQFLYEDNTPAFSYNAQIVENEVGTYLENISPVLLAHSEGYGLWAYRGYKSNMIYNSQFGLEGAGWDYSDEIEFEILNGSMRCVLTDGDVLRQSVPAVRNHYPNEIYFFELDVVDCVDDTEIILKVGNQERTICVSSNTRYSVKFDNCDSFDIEIATVAGEATIDNLRFYSFIQESRIYDADNTELELANSIRLLNEQLSYGF